MNCPCGAELTRLAGWGSPEIFICQKEGLVNDVKHVWTLKDGELIGLNGSVIADDLARALLYEGEQRSEFINDIWNAVAPGEPNGWDYPGVVLREVLHIVERLNNAEIKLRERTERPWIVALCGSTRFSETFQKANLAETLAGRIVLTIGCDMRSDHEIFADMNEEEKAKIKRGLDELHLRKIDMADEVLILNVGGYIGESTQRELAYAREHDKRVRYWEPVPALRSE